MKAHSLIQLEHFLSPALKFLPSKKKIEIYSRGRKKVLEALSEEKIERKFSPSRDFEKIFWGIKFPSQIMNAAGMFKNGECYELMAKQGAGAYLGGTTTALRRTGNIKDDIANPFIPLPKSASALNYLGLPNDGDDVVLKLVREISKMKKNLKCPIGWSLSYQPNFNLEKQMEMLVRSIRNYSHAGVDFLEFDESCPNTERENYGFSELSRRLSGLRQMTNEKNIPWIVKFSNDVDVSQVGGLIELLIDLKYDGVNFGNTLTNYNLHSEKISESEKKVFNYFTKTFGGGVSGRPLKEKSLELCTEAVHCRNKMQPNQEFHVIRTGGIENAQDIINSENAGISLNQWFTGYWKNFRLHGHELYSKLYSEL